MSLRCAQTRTVDAIPDIIPIVRPERNRCSPSPPLLLRLMMKFAIQTRTKDTRKGPSYGQREREREREREDDGWVRKRGERARTHARARARACISRRESEREREEGEEALASAAPAAGSSRMTIISGHWVHGAWRLSFAPYSYACPSCLSKPSLF